MRRGLDKIYSCSLFKIALMTRLLRLEDKKVLLWTDSLVRTTPIHQPTFCPITPTNRQNYILYALETNTRTAATLANCFSKRP